MLMIYTIVFLSSSISSNVLSSQIYMYSEILYSLSGSGAETRMCIPQKRNKDKEMKKTVMKSCTVHYLINR